MRIAMIGQKTLASGEKAGGVEKHVAEVSRRLVRAGHDVTAYVRVKYTPKRPKTFEGVHLEYVKTLYSKNLEAIVYSFIATIKAIFGDFDIIHYHGVGPATVAWIARLFARNSTTVVTFHSRDQFHKKWGWFARHYLAIGEWAAVKLPHYCISVSHVIQVYCRNTFKREVVYIPNGAEVIEVTRSNELEKFGLRANNFLLNVGRLVPQKGLHFLIEAFATVETDMNLVFVGAPSFTDEYYTSLRDLAKNDSRVKFLGFQQGEVLDQLYGNAYLYVHPSEAEGLPLTILEAMSHGTAPLVSDIPENLEAIHNAGYAFKSGDVLELRHKLTELLMSPDDVNEKSEDAQAMVETNFNWDKIAEHIEEVYVTARH
ncbi:MAG: glycosyltransferase family 4 protein [Candidatus Uhrbacteria bacterium]|nr:glycosyltransferase family 4 protein [Candidatus Uhrbacteria bacterium]